MQLYRELKEYSWQSELYCTLCHICKQKESLDNNQMQRYVLRIASIGDTVTILCRNTGSLTLSHSSKQVRYFCEPTKSSDTMQCRTGHVDWLTITDQWGLMNNRRGSSELKNLCVRLSKINFEDALQRRSGIRQAIGKISFAGHYLDNRKPIPPPTLSSGEKVEI